MILVQTTVTEQRNAAFLTKNCVVVLAGFLKAKMVTCITVDKDNASIHCKKHNKHNSARNRHLVHVKLFFMCSSHSCPSAYNILVIVINHSVLMQRDQT